MKNTVLWAFAAGAAVAVVAVALRLTEEQRHAKRAEVLADLSARVDQLADTVHKEADLVLAKTLDVTAQSVDTADRATRQAAEQVNQSAESAATHVTSAADKAAKSAKDAADASSKVTAAP